MTTYNEAARAARATLGPRVTHFKRTDGLGHFAGPLCGQRALDGKSWAHAPYTTSPLRVTCKKCDRALKAAGGWSDPAPAASAPTEAPTRGTPHP